MNVLLGLGGKKRRKHMAKIKANSSEKRKLNWSIGRPAILATGLRIYEPLYVEPLILLAVWSIMIVLLIIFYFEKINIYIYLSRTNN